MRFQNPIAKRACCCAALVAVLALTSQASAQVKISQVYGAGGNTQAPLAHDYVELYNTGAPADLTGWSVQYAAATGTTWTVTALPSVILGTGKYFLVKQSNGGTINDETGTVAIGNQVPGLPAPDATGTAAMAADAFKVALVSSTTALVGGTPTYAANPTLVDFIGCGTTANWNDASANGAAHVAANNAPPASVAHALYRLNCGPTDTNVSRADWAVGWPAPRNTATPANLGISTIGTALPLTVEELQSIRLTATPFRCATSDLGTGTTVSVNTTLIGGGPTAMLDDGVAPDEVANDGVYTTVVTVPAGTATGTKNLPVTIADGGGLSGGSYISILVKATTTPDNDNCMGAAPLAVPSQTLGTFTGLTVESNSCAPVPTMTAKRGMWFTIVGTGNTITLTTCASPLNGTAIPDTVIDVFCGSCDGLTTIAGNDDTPALCGVGTGTERRSTLSFCSALGTTYYVWLAPFATGAQTFAFTLDITDSGAACGTAFPCTSCLGVSGPYTETEPGYGPHNNDGCGSTPNLFTDIASPATGSTVIRGAARGMTGNRDVDAYRFQATTSGVLTMTMDTLGANAQAQLNTLAAGGVCPQVNVVNTPVTFVRCATGTQTSVATTINAGQWYVIQVVGGIGIQVTAPATYFGGHMPGGTTHQYTLTLNLAPAGACCRPDGTCAVLTEAGCDSLGVGAVFHPDEPCPPAAACAPGGACCLTDGTCSILIQSVCEANPNFYRWTLAATCTPNLCAGRCCHADGTCTVVIAPLCNLPGDVYAGDGTACSVSGDECKGRCCAGDGTCTLTGPANCVLPNRFGGVGTNCNPTPTGIVSNYGAPTPPTVIIPTTGTGGLAGVGATLPSVINVPDSFLVADVNVRVKIQHTFRADLLICLQPPSGPSISLTSTPGCGGVTGSGICGGEDNLNAIFDDEGVAVVCASANLGSLVAAPDSIRPLPLSPGLAAADGLTALGDWTLIIYDDAGGDSGTLLEWELFLERGAVPCQGACCVGPACTVLSSDACGVAGGIYSGDGTLCSPNPCVPNGACCLTTGCTIQSQADCNTAGGVYGGDSSTCTSPAPCQAPCCKSDGTCDLRTIASCSALAGAVPGALGTPCPPAPCAPLGACCAADGSCTVVTQAACLASGGIRWTEGGSCTPNLCRGRCCAPDGTCSVTFSPGTVGAASCESPSVYSGDGTDCDLLNVYQFNGVNLVLEDVPAGVLSSNVQTVSSSTPLIISDIDVDLNGTHTWPGDISFTLSHAGTSVVIYDRPGVPASTFGCATDNFNFILDDEGTGGPIETVCNAAPPSALSPPNFTPNNPLAAFDGLDAVGDWTITCADGFTGGDTGTLLSWSLHITYQGSPCPTPVDVTCTAGDMDHDGDVDGTDIQVFTDVLVGTNTNAQAVCDADVDTNGTTELADVLPMVGRALAAAANNYTINAPAAPNCGSGGGSATITINPVTSVANGLLFVRNAGAAGDCPANVQAYDAANVRTGPPAGWKIAPKGAVAIPVGTATVVYSCPTAGPACNVTVGP